MKSKLMRDNLCEHCYKEIQIGQIGQEETAVILSIKPYQMGMILQGCFKVPSYIAKAEVSDNLKIFQYLYT
jgi:hypothetical protein